MFRLLVVVAVVLSAVAASVSGEAYTVVYQDQGYTGVWLERYDELFQGSPRSLAYKFGQGDLANSLGVLCDGDLQTWNVLGNDSPGTWNFNCVHAASEVTANVNNVGYTVGGLNHDDSTVAICTVADQSMQLCDSDTGGGEHCKVYLICQ